MKTNLPEAKILLEDTTPLLFNELASKVVAAVYKAQANGLRYAEVEVTFSQSQGWLDDLITELEAKGYRTKTREEKIITSFERPGVELVVVW